MHACILSVFRKICFLSGSLTLWNWEENVCTSFNWNVDYVLDEGYYYVKAIFKHAYMNVVQITPFLRWAQNKLSNWLFCRTFKKFILDLISDFLTDGISWLYLEIWNEYNEKKYSY